jgi:hypothetical protein
MSFQTGSATSVGDLLTKWFNFLQANGWTADLDYTSDGQSPHYGIINRQGSKSGSSPLDGDLTNYVNLYCGFSNLNGTDLLMFPSRGYTSGDPRNGAIEGVQSNNYTSTTNSLQTNFPTAPFENYWFFESDFYAHAVVEYSAGFFRHFGMGSVNKYGKYLGGEYYYGTYWSQGAFTIDAPLSTSHYPPFDNGHSFGSVGTKFYGKLLNGQAFPFIQGRQSPDSAWFSATSTADNGSGVTTDNDGRDVGNLRCDGPRGGKHYTIYHIAQSTFNGYRPMFPITLSVTRNQTPDPVYFVGSVPDMRSISMKGNLLPGDEFTIGTDTWIAFPLVRRSAIVLSDDTETTGLMGIAYKKVLT